MLTLFGAPTTLGELLAFVTGALSVWFVVRENIWTFPVGIANVILLGILFLRAELYADAALQVLYVGLQVMGWWAWLRLGPGGGELEVASGGRWLAGGLCGVVVGSVVLVPVLREAGDSAPLWDGITTSLSLAAQTLLSFKRIENWYLWMTADVIYIPLYISKELVLTAVVYVMFLGLCVLGVRRWRVSIRASRRFREPLLTPALAATRDR